MNASIGSFFCRLFKDEGGAVAVIVALSLVPLLGMAGIAIDFGYLYRAKLALQASTDAAALAAAQEINVGAGGTAIATATAYSSVVGGKNAANNLTATMVSGYPKLKCLTSTGISCGGPDSANAIVVQQQAAVPTFFAKIFGVRSWNVMATATAGAKGGVQSPIDVMLVLDTTASMNTADPSCGNATREDCALQGVRTLLNAMNPCASSLSTCGSAMNGNVANPMARVGLMVFPGLQNTTPLTGQQNAAKEYDCNTGGPTIVPYSASPAPLYQIVSLSSDYRASDTAAVNPNSQLVLAARGGGASCAQGLSAVGGEGTYFADAINAAQAALLTDGRSNAQKVIVLLSDGDASAKAPAQISAAKGVNECRAAITAAQNTTNAGTWVYSIAYGAPTGSSCGTDSPAITACSTMQQIASGSTVSNTSPYFYSDTSSQKNGCSSPNSVASLAAIFAAISTSVTSVRLLPDNTI